MNGSHAAAMTAGLIAAVFFHAISTSASSQETSGAVQLRPGVVIDPDRKVAYVMSVEGGIDALEVSQGKPVWTTKDAAMPLGLKDDMLVAQIEPTDTSRELKVVALDTRKRGQPMVTGSMMLPAGSQATIDDTLAGSFVASASGLDDDALVSWKFTKREFRGVPPADETDDAANDENARSAPQPSSGTLRLDLSSGEMSNVSTANAASRGVVRTIDVPEAERIPGIPGPQFLSADDRHIQTSQRIGDDRVFEKFRWTIYARDTKEIVGRINSHVPFASFFVTGAHVILVTEPYARRVEGRMQQEPLRIRAVDLRTGEEAWSHDVRDTEYRGPYPP